MAEEKDKKLDESKKADTKAEVKADKKDEKKAEPAAKKEEVKKEEKKAEPEKKVETKVEIKKEEPKAESVKVEEPKKAEPEKKPTEFQFIEGIKVWKNADIQNTIPFIFTGNIKILRDLTNEIAVIQYLHHGYGLVEGYILKADLK